MEFLLSFVGSILRNLTVSVASEHLQSFPFSFSNRNRGKIKS